MSVPANTIAAVAPTIADLKQLSTRQQGGLLLRRLAHLYPRGNSFSKTNFALHSPNILDPYGLATGYPPEEVCAVILHLLREPWHFIEQNFYIALALSGQGFYEITEKGWSEVETRLGVYVPNEAVIEALSFMHEDLQGYGHYFQEQKRKEAVAAAFKRVENRLNEIRDSSQETANAAASGVSLPHKLFDSGDLKLPFPNLATNNPTARSAYVQSLRNLLASGIGWFRNSFDHEPHNLPEFDEAETLEHLFVASYMLRVIDKSR